ncbi:MAG: hypothetical protein ACT4OS_01455 [Acidimicrobiales bacterium]
MGAERTGTHFRPVPAGTGRWQLIAVAWRPSWHNLEMLMLDCGPSTKEIVPMATR